MARATALLNSDVTDSLATPRSPSRVALPRSISSEALEEVPPKSAPKVGVIEIGDDGSSDGGCRGGAAT